MSGFGEGRYSHTFGEEVFIDRLTLTGGTVSSNQVTGLSGLTANKYDDQDVLVMDGSIAGRRLRCVTNTTSALTFQQDVETLGLANTDTLQFGARGKRPSTYNIFWSAKDEFMMPTPKHTVDRPRYSGTGLKPADTIVLKTDFENRIPFLLSDPRLLFTWFGDEYVTGTDTSGGGGSTLNGAIKAGETVFDVADATNYATDDYIQVDTGTSAEIRKITGISTNTITVDYPLRKNHSDGATCNEVEKPFTHNLQVADRGIYWTYQGVYDESPTPTVREAHGCYTKEFEVKGADTSYLQCSIAYEAMTTSTDGSKQTPDSTSLPQPYIYDKVNNGIQVNGITYAQVREWSVKGIRTIERLGYSSSLYGVKPAGFATGAVAIELSLVVDVPNANFLSLVEDKTEFTVVIDCVRTSSSDEFRITTTNTIIEDAPHPITPDGATVKVTATMGAEDIAVRVIDDIPYYPMGVHT